MSKKNGTTVVCLMGPTAAGKTGVAVRLAQELPFDIVSVDSAMVYRHMDIGTAKPNAATLSAAPHRLIDIRDPEDAYSAGEFVRDAKAAIQSIVAAGRVPLLVGGTMLYFRALMEGIARLPAADPGVRDAIEREAAKEGWPALHRKLESVDPVAAGRIAPNDRQRIQRALEVYRLSGTPLSSWQADTPPGAGYRFVRLALIDPDRAVLHERINARVTGMLEQGLLDEVTALRARPGLSADTTSMRAVGYRQFWAHLEGKTDLDAAIARARAATRQLAKRQLTWLRSEPDLAVFDPLAATTYAEIRARLATEMNK